MRNTGAWRIVVVLLCFLVIISTASNVLLWITLGRVWGWISVFNARLTSLDYTLTRHTTQGHQGTDPAERIQGDQHNGHSRGGKETQKPGT